MEQFPERTKQSYILLVFWSTFLCGIQKCFYTFLSQKNRTQN